MEAVCLVVLFLDSDEQHAAGTRLGLTIEEGSWYSKISGKKETIIEQLLSLTESGSLDEQEDIRWITPKD